MANEYNNHLKVPEDLIIQIFLRSSVETLLRAKSICKWWYALIMNHDFILTHLEQQKVYNKGRLLLQYRKEDQISYALFDDRTLVSDTYHDLVQLSNSSFNINGPIKGLFFFNSYDRIVLWNPALMEFKTVPMPHPHFFPCLSVLRGEIGFGTDPHTHDYKLVLICNFNDRFLWYSRKYVTLYNLTTNTWRLLYDIGDSFLIHEEFDFSQSSLFLNGIYYWWLVTRVIISFDIREETFRKILGPNNCENLCCVIDSPMVYNNKVSLLFSNRSVIDIWVMLGECDWIKEASIISFPEPEQYIVIGLWKNNEFVFTAIDYETSGNNSRIILYNAITQKMRNLDPKGLDMCWHASVYDESLVTVDHKSKHKGKRASPKMISHFLDYSSNPYLEMERPDRTLSAVE